MSTYVFILNKILEAILKSLILSNKWTNKLIYVLFDIKILNIISFLYMHIDQKKTNISKDQSKMEGSGEQLGDLGLPNRGRRQRKRRGKI